MLRILRIGSPTELRRLLRDLSRIWRLVADPELTVSYHPGEPRKSKARILSDLVIWRAVRGEVNQHYYRWGMDRVRGGPRPRDLLSDRQFQSLRDEQNLKAGDRFSYIALMRDKYLFSLFLESLGYPAPRLLALVSSDAVDWLNPRRTAPLSSLAEADLDAFCKPRFGAHGHGVFRLQVEGCRIRINGEPATAEELAARVRPGVLQQTVVQHPILAQLHPHSVNTLRLVTVRDATGTARLFSRPMLRVGLGGRVVDNAGSGGIQVFMDADTGRLRAPGLMQRGGAVSVHPDSGIALDGFEVPHFARAVELAERLHDEVPGLHSIGWDLAIAQDGPVFIEGNDNWGAGLRLGLDPDFKRQFLQLCARG
jgi:hypothetical protein